MANIIVDDEKDFCSFCGSDERIRVDGNPEEESGTECANCGKNFIADEVQPVYKNLPYSLTDTLYIDRD